MWRGSGKHPILATTICSGDYEVICCFSRAFGGNVRKAPGATKRRQMWQWSLCGTQAQKFIAEIGPYLRSDKAKQVALALLPTFHRGIKPSSQEIELREHARVAISAINNRAA